MAIDQTLPPEVFPTSAPASAFSAERVIEHIESSDASNVSYTGDPTLGTIDISGVSSVKTK